MADDAEPPLLIVAPQPFFRTSGTPIAIAELCRALVASGFRVTLLSLPLGQDLPIAGVTHHRTNRVPFIRQIPIGFSLAKMVYDVMLAIRLVRLLRRQRYLAIQAIEEAAIFAAPLARMFRIPLVVDVDSNLAIQLASHRSRFARVLSPLARRLLARTMRQAACIVTVAPRLTELVRTISPTAAIVEVRDCVTAELGRPPDGAAVARLRAAFEVEGREVVLYTGNLEAYQGIELLLGAFALVRRRRPAAVLVVIGGEPLQIDHLGTIARRLHIRKSVRFVGKRPIEDMPEAMALADVLVSPRLEPAATPLKIYGYMASGRPIVATDLPAHNEVLDASTAVLVPATEADLADGIVRVLSDSKAAAALARAAAERARICHSRASFFRDVQGLVAELRRTAQRRPS
ncbi:MAG TPA: glycosyltransferase family 4 protein [Geminicoccaceae bacterium]|nr:glycosyltransferase family 4 protein [Geminicoccaceae bacterium]